MLVENSIVTANIVSVKDVMTTSCQCKVDRLNIVLIVTHLIQSEAVQSISETDLNVSVKDVVEEWYWKRINAKHVQIILLYVSIGIIQDTIVNVLLVLEISYHNNL